MKLYALLLGSLLTMPCCLPARAESQVMVDTLETELRAMAGERTEVLELGRTAGSRPVLALRIAAADGAARPAIAVVGGLGPYRFMSERACVRMAVALTDGSNPQASAILERATVYVIPMASPDALFPADPGQTDGTNAVPADDDRDGRVDEDGPDDLDGDGVITSMRVKDPAGRWRAHPLDPRVLIPVKPELNEAGEYSLYTEGTDNDGDGQFNEDGPGGVDFNRNWTWNYPEYQAGAGPWPVSEPETRAVADFFYAHPEIALVYTLGPQDNLAHPWQAGNDGGRIKTGVLDADAPVLKYISEEYKKQLDTAAAPEGAAGAGSLGYWAYFHYGRWSLMAQPWWVPEPPAAEQPADAADPAAADAPAAPAEAVAAEAAKPIWDDKDERGKDELRKLKWLEEHGGDGFAPWTTVQLDDFPGREVEVGGFRESLIAASVPRLTEAGAPLGGPAEPQLAFLSEVTGLLPRLSIDNVEVTPLGEGVWRVEARVVNTGFLPTFSAMGELSGQIYPVQATLALPDGAQLLSGRQRQFVPRLDGNGGSAELSWLVSGLAPGSAVGLTAAAPAVGRAQQTIEIGAGQ
jgi:hypothetical protein